MGMATLAVELGWTEQQLMNENTFPFIECIIKVLNKKNGSKL